jgi:TorA maturation chaperone TorD
MTRLATPVGWNFFQDALCRSGWCHRAPFPWEPSLPKRYAALFEGTGGTWLHEGSHVTDRHQRSRLKADLGALYAVMGRSRQLASGVDHVSTECEAMSGLCEAEARALEAGDTAGAMHAREAQRILVERHLARLADPLRDYAEHMDPAGFYGTVAGQLDQFLATDRKQLRVTAGAKAVAMAQAQAAV